MARKETSASTPTPPQRASSLPSFSGNVTPAATEDVIRLREQVAKLQGELREMLGMKNQLVSMVGELKGQNKLLEQQQVQANRDRFKSKSNDLKLQRDGIKSSKTTPSAIESGSGGSKMFALMGLLLVGAGKVIADNMTNSLPDPKPSKSKDKGRTFKGMEDEERGGDFFRGDAEMTDEENAMFSRATGKTPIDKLINKQKNKSKAFNTNAAKLEAIRQKNMARINAKLLEEDRERIREDLDNLGFGGSPGSGSRQTNKAKMDKHIKQVALLRKKEKILRDLQLRNAFDADDYEDSQTYTIGGDKTTTVKPPSVATVLEQRKVNRDVFNKRMEKEKEEEKRLSTYDAFDMGLSSQIDLDRLQIAIKGASPINKTLKGQELRDLFFEMNQFGEDEVTEPPSESFFMKLGKGIWSIVSPKPLEAAPLQTSSKSSIGATFKGMEREEGGGGLYVGANELNAYLLGYGIPSMHAAGIVANVERESGGFLISRKQFKGGPGRGLFQFEGTRLTAMKKYMKDNYGNENEWETNWEAQVDFLMQETNKNNYERTMRNRFFMRNYSTPQEAAKGFMELVLRPAAWAREGAMKRMETKMQQLPFFRNLGPLDNFSTDGVINSTTIIGPQHSQESQTLNIVAVQNTGHGSSLMPKLGLHIESGQSWRNKDLVKK